jgi:hypothetical protein
MLLPEYAAHSQGIKRSQESGFSVHHQPSTLPPLILLGSFVNGLAGKFTGKPRIKLENRAVFL